MFAQQHIYCLFSLYVPVDMWKSGWTVCTLGIMPVISLKGVRYHRPSHGSGGWSSASNCGGPGSIPVQCMWNLCWTPWQWHRYSLPALPFSPIPPMLDTHSFIYHRRCIILTGDSVCLGYRVWNNFRWSKFWCHSYADDPHSVLSLTTGPQPLSKRVLHRVRSSASCFSFQYLLFSLRSSSSCLHLFPRLSVTSILPSIFPSITCFRRQFLRKMWPIQLAFSWRYHCFGINSGYTNICSIISQKITYVFWYIGQIRSVFKWFVDCLYSTWHLR
jgi:hypothetical protein